MKPWLVALLVCSCAASRAVVRSEQCQQAFDQCNNRCFQAPNYPHGGPQCTEVRGVIVCPQEGQPVDTLAAAKCFQRCEWDDRVCAQPVWQSEGHDSARDGGGGGSLDAGLLE